MYFIVAVVVIGGCVTAYHLYRVKAKNAAEMAMYEAEVKLNANLGKVLVVYYSLSGHTEDIAFRIIGKTHADSYKIETVEEYTTPSVYMKSKKELSEKNYPELKDNPLPDFSKYDVVFIGGPVWWYTMASPLYSFLNKADLRGVKVVPFSTQGSNYGTFFEDFTKAAEGADILPGKSFNNVEEKYTSHTSNKINAWLNQLSNEKN